MVLYGQRLLITRGVDLHLFEYLGSGMTAKIRIESYYPKTEIVLLTDDTELSQGAICANTLNFILHNSTTSEASRLLGQHIANILCKADDGLETKGLVN